MSPTRAEIYHNLSTLLDAGVPISRALETAGGRLSGVEVYALLSAEIGRGKTLAEAVEGHADQFPLFDRTMIRVGESAGRLAEVFGNLADWHAFEGAMKKRVRSALILPAIVIHAAALVSPLPELLTQNSGGGAFLIGAGSILFFWYALAFLCWWLPRVPALSGTLDRLLISLPGVGPALQNRELSRYCRAFYGLYEAGVPMAETAQSAVDVMTNHAAQRLVAGGPRSARAGEPVSAGFAPDLPSGFIAVWQSAELSGTLGQATARLARRCAKDAEEGFERLQQWIPRIVYGLVMVQMVYLILSRGAAIYGGG